MRGIDLKKIAEKMNGASGAELKVRFAYTIIIIICLVIYLYHYSCSPLHLELFLQFCRN